MIAASGPTNLPSRWSSNHVEVLPEHPNRWVISQRPDFWPCNTSGKVFQKEYRCFQHFVPMQTQYTTYTPREQPPCRMGGSRPPGDTSGTLGSPRGWGQAACPRVPSASGELLKPAPDFCRRQHRMRPLLFYHEGQRCPDEQEFSSLPGPAPGFLRLPITRWSVAINHHHLRGKSPCNHDILIPWKTRMFQS